MRNLLGDYMVGFGVIVALVAMALWCEGARAEPPQAVKVCTPASPMPAFKRANFGHQRSPRAVPPVCHYEFPGQDALGVPASVPIGSGMVVDVRTGYRVPAVRRSVYGYPGVYRGHHGAPRGYGFTPLYQIHTVRERWVWHD